MYIPADGMISNTEFLLYANSIANTSQVIIDNKKIAYYNLPAGFDIETSSFYEGGDGKQNKRAIMYIWQFGLGNKVTFGRTWRQFVCFIKALSVALGTSKVKKLVVYVHNLPYEFQFMRKWLLWDNVFLLKDRKPVYSEMRTGIIFKCMLKLSGGKSLENVAKDLNKYRCKKLSGYLDYTQIRTPITPLTNREYKYCEYDIRVILHYIQEKIEIDGNITKIPLTNTGYVREHCRDACYRRWKPYRKLMDELRMSVDEYNQLKRAYQGGFTHANAIYVSRNEHPKTLDNVYSDDFGSSYPACMVVEKFPMSPAHYVGQVSYSELKDLLRTKCCLFDIEIQNVVPRIGNEHPITKSKCRTSLNRVINNGRVVSADWIRTTITEQDFFTINEFYEFDNPTIWNLRIYEKNYLPRPFVKSILELYEKKTKLKGLEAEIINYVISKNMINAGYGMMVTNPVRPDIVYQLSHKYEVNPIDVYEAIEKYNNNIRRFLFYPWGVWVTAYARANLFSGIAELGEDYIYSDTDSLKYFNRDKHVEYFRRYNEQQIEKINRASLHQRIDLSMFIPKTSPQGNRPGKEKPIGLWEHEGKYEKFKTLGAKRYMTFRHVTEKFEDNGLSVELTVPTYELTVAGTNKIKTMGYLRLTGDPFKEFEHGLCVPSDRSGRLILTYIDDEIEGDVVDMYGNPYHYYEKSFIHMEASEYNLSQGNDFIGYLKQIEERYE